MKTRSEYELEAMNLQNTRKIYAPTLFKTPVGYLHLQREGYPHLQRVWGRWECTWLEVDFSLDTPDTPS